MKKELREAVAKEKKYQQKGSLAKLIEDNKGVVTALGIASFVALAGYSASQLLKNKKLMKKIKDGIKTPKALKYVEDLLAKNALKEEKAPKQKAAEPADDDAAPAKKKAAPKAKPAAATKKKS